MKTPLYLLPFVALFCGCASVDIRTHHHPTLALQDYRTYAWETREAAKGDASSDFAPMHDTLLQAVNRELGTRGYVQTSMEIADLRVHHAVNVVIEETTTPSDIVDSNNPGSSLLNVGGGRVELEARADTTDIQEVETATLVISLKRPGEDEPVWMTVATGELLKSLPMDIRKQRLRNTITKMFKDLPAR